MALGVVRSLLASLLLVAATADARAEAPDPARDRELAARGMFDAGARMEYARSFVPALETYRRVVAMFPEQPWALHAQAGIGILLEARCDFEEAAAAFVLLDDMVQRGRVSDAALVEHAAVSLRNAGQLYSALGEHAKASDLFTRYVRQYPTRPDARLVALEAASQTAQVGGTAAALRAAAMYEAAAKGVSDPDFQIRAFGAAAAAAQSGNAPRRRVAALAARVEQAWQRLSLDHLVEQVDPVTLYYVLLMRLFAADQTIADFAALSIQEQPARTLKRTLEAKRKAFDAAHAALDRVAAIGTARAKRESVARLGELYIAMARSLPTIARDAGHPFFDEARRLLVPLVEAPPFGDPPRYDDAAARAANALAALDPERYPLPPTARTAALAFPVKSVSFIREVRRGDARVDFLRRYGP